MIKTADFNGINLLLSQGISKLAIRIWWRLALIHHLLDQLP
jgi:hypothetical protein